MILIGFMGAGKTTVGKALSETINQPFYDLDHEITKEINMPIADYFSLYGEQMFRGLEARYLEEYSNFPAVISTGGGCIETEINRKLLKNRNDVFYLQANFEVLLERIKNDMINIRPTAKNKSYEELKAVLTKRLDYYEQCANYVISTDDLSVDEVVKEIISQLLILNNAMFTTTKRSIPNE